MKQKKNIAAVVREIVEPVADEMGYILWNVEYVKEGADMILRITLDKDGDGITIDDCERLHRAIDPLLDEADPIEDSYMLEVSSPGVERELTLPLHFERMAGEEVEVRLYAAVDGQKVWRGELLGLRGDDIAIKLPDGEEKLFPQKSAAKCETKFAWE